MTAPPLGGRDVHVWRLALDREPTPAEQALLSREERERAARFRLPGDRRRFVRAHAGMRAILGAYAGIAPERLAFFADAHGKPRLDRIELGFNLSHSGERALLAVARVAHVGVDIEEAAGRIDIRLLAARLFTAEERGALEGLDDAALATPFLTCWTRKEAVLKAIGVGLTVEPSQFHVGTATGRGQAASAGLAPHLRVDVVSLPPQGASHAAVAVVGGFGAVRMFDEPARAGWTAGVARA